MILFPLLGHATLIAFALYIPLWLLSLRSRSVTIIDPFWGLGFGVIGWGLCLYYQTWSWFAFLPLVCISIWGLRYAIHIYWRSWGHREEQSFYPYAEWRAQSGKHFWWVSFFRVFLAQILGHLLIGLGLWVRIAQAHDFSLKNMMPQAGQCLWSTALGIALWFLGVCCEGIADYQLACFKRDPANAGKVLDRGLWRYSRHPNYFGDILMWWGMFFLCWSQDFWMTLCAAVGPIVMTVILTLGSGVSLVEKRAKVAQKPAYAEYKKKTSALIPWFPAR